MKGLYGHQGDDRCMPNAIEQPQRFRTKNSFINNQKLSSAQNVHLEE
jgi:hypothetical protein